MGLESLIAFTVNHLPYNPNVTFQYSMDGLSYVR